MRPAALQLKKPIWLIDDYEELRTVASALFENDPHYHLRCFPSCEEAFRAAKEDTASPVAILLDIELPGMNGIDAIGHLKKLLPGIKIIILSNFD